MLIEQMTKRLEDQAAFDDAVRVVLHDAIALHGAEFGNVQLKAGEDVVIVAQWGFKKPFLEFFRKVTPEDRCCCGRALSSGRIVVVPDIEKDEEFAPYRDVVRAAGVKSCMTTPLLSSQKVFIGNVSTHFATIHTPTAIEVDTIKSYSVAAANHLLKLLGDESLKTKAISMSRGLYEEAGATLVYTERLGGLYDETNRKSDNLPSPTRP
jgi:GAF domain-containing protein